MAIKKLEKKEWKSYFDRFSKSYIRNKRTDYAEIQMLSDEAGMAYETDWVLLKGITYNSKDDSLEIDIEDLGHRIYQPNEIYVDEDGRSGISSLEIVEKNGNKDIIELR